MRQRKWMLKLRQWEFDHLVEAQATKTPTIAQLKRDVGWQRENKMLCATCESALRTVQGHVTR